MELKDNFNKIDRELAEQGMELTELNPYMANLKNERYEFCQLLN